jgi:hypothetical protein
MVLGIAAFASDKAAQRRAGVTANRKKVVIPARAGTQKFVVKKPHDGCAHVLRMISVTTFALYAKIK